MSEGGKKSKKGQQIRLNFEKWTYQSMNMSQFLVFLSYLMNRKPAELHRSNLFLIL